MNPPVIPFHNKLEKTSRTELKKLCQDHGIHILPKWTRKNIIQALDDARTPIADDTSPLIKMTVETVVSTLYH